MTVNINKFKLRLSLFLVRVSLLSTEFSLSHSHVGDWGEGKREVPREFKDIGKEKKAIQLYPSQIARKKI